MRLTASARRTIVAMSLWAGMAGCVREHRSALVAPIVDSLSGGIVRVRNRGPSRWIDTSGWKLVLERTLHPATGSPGELIRPGAFVATEGGDLFVLDRKPPALKHYRADGTFVGVIGREGSCPGEYRDYGTLYIVGDTLIHQDAGQSRIATFTTAGQFLRSWTSSPMTETELVADDSGRVPIGAATGTTRISGGHGLIRFRLDGSVADTVTYPDAPEPKLWSLKNAHTDMGMVIPFSPDRVTALDRSGRLIWGDQSAYRLTVSRRGTDTTRMIESAAATVAIPDSIRQRTLLDAMKHHTWLRGIAKLEDIPREYPAWTSLTADGANNLWVLRPGPRGAGDHWDVFDSDGRLFGAVPAPFDHTDDTFWTRDHVYLLQQDGPDGTPAVLVYRIDRTQP